MPVNWRARVVVPVYCGATPNGPLLPVGVGAMGVLRVGEGEPRRFRGRISYKAEYDQLPKSSQTDGGH